MMMTGTRPGKKASRNNGAGTKHVLARTTLCPTEGDRLMKQVVMIRWSVLIACLLVTAAGATAEVYESRDAAGNPVFSDRPSSGAKAIEVPPTNSADSVEPREPPPAPSAPPAARQAPAQPAAAQAATERDDDDYIYYGGADNDAARQRLEERREDAADRPDRDPPPRAQQLPTHARPGVGGGRR